MYTVHMYNTTQKHSRYLHPLKFAQIVLQVSNMSENCMGELVSVILLVVCVQVCVLSSRQHACMHMYVHVHSLCMQEDNTH